MHISPDARLVLTGSYNSSFHVIDVINGTNNTIEAKFMDKRGKHVGSTRSYKGKRVHGILTSQVGEPVRIDMS